MKLLVIIFGVLVLWIGYSQFFKPDPLAYNEELTLHSDTKILAFGDSLTRGTGARTPYPQRLGELLGVQIANEGIPGEVSSEGLKRLPQAMEKHNPDIVILCHGGNDILRRLDLGQTEQNLRNMIHYIQQNGAKVFLVGVPMFEGLSIDTAAFYDSLAKEFNLPYAPKILTQIINDPELKSDRVHPNDQGYERLALRLRALLLEYYGQ